MTVLAKNGVWLGASLTEVDFSSLTLQLYACVKLVRIKCDRDSRYKIQDLSV